MQVGVVRYLLIIGLLLSLCQPVFSRDPTKPPVALQLQNGNMQKGQLALSGIIDRDDARLAIINGQLVKKNEFLEGFKVTQIASDRVILEHRSGDRQIVLTMVPRWRQVKS